MNRTLTLLCVGTLALTVRAADPPWAMADGPFQPQWKSLQQYQTPEWFRDAKFGIWAHWGPQCQPENGDWYARNMYIPGQADYRFHVEHYGHPSRFGFKDVIHEWKAERFDPEKLLALYKRAGTIDSDEVKVLEDLAAWIAVNGEAIYGTRPWKVYGEGPSTRGQEANTFGGVKDVGSKPFTAADIRFTTKGEALYTIALGWPADGKLRVRSLASGQGEVRQVRLLGHDSNLEFKQTTEGLEVTLPSKAPCEHAFALKVTGTGLGR
jgi:alpha-L-fucosidase